MKNIFDKLCWLIRYLEGLLSRTNVPVTYPFTHISAVPFACFFLKTVLAIRWNGYVLFSQNNSIFYFYSINFFNFFYEEKSFCFLLLNCPPYWWWESLLCLASSLQSLNFPSKLKLHWWKTWNTVTDRTAMTRNRKQENIIVSD